MKKIILAAFFLLYVGLYAQEIQLSEAAKISVITVDPGNQLVDSFGHSAFRVQDELLGIDQAYNYGMYNFNTPNFYTKFAQGKLLYDLGSYPFHYFLKDYVSQNRSVKEQMLNLDVTNKQAFFDFLQENAKPENKSYLYDFLFDNCATKLPEVSQNILNDNIEFSLDFSENEDATFRDLIQQNLAEQPWGSFGIDLALGSVIDRKANDKEYMFLPAYVFEAYEKSQFNNQPLVKNTQTLFASTPHKEERYYLQPILVFSILSFIGIWITFRDYKKGKRSKGLDFILFFSTGLIGLLVLLLWFATDHSATAKNFNVLWAFMPNLFVAFVLLKKDLKNWIGKYLKFLVLLLLLMSLLWLLKVQIFAMALLPILLLLAVRYLFLIKRSV